MTEYKKLVTLTEELHNDVAKLHSVLLVGEGSAAAEGVDVGNTPSSSKSGSVDAEDVHLLASRISHAVIDGCGRVRRMVLKARETDPNRQIYNETMCKRIEQLFVSLCLSLQLLAPEFAQQKDGADEAAVRDEEQPSSSFDDILNVDFDAGAIVEQSPALQAAERLYSAHIIARAREEAWQSRVAQGLSDVLTFEAQGRSLFAAEEKMARTAMEEDRRRDKMRVIRLLEEREAAKWDAEVQRRRAELAALRAATTSIQQVSSVPAWLRSTVTDVAMQRKLAGHVQQLIHALLRAPEDLNIRRLRNNNEHLICDYGHPCLNAAALSSDGTQCGCARAVQAAEVLWCRMGYTIRYTNAPNRSVETARLEQRADGVMLPCGLPLAAHSYTPQGFEDYSERYLELIEPNAMESPDEWMVWYGMMQEMEAVLLEFLAS